MLSVWAAAGEHGPAQPARPPARAVPEHYLESGPGGRGRANGGGGALAGGGEMGDGREEGRREGEAWVERLRFFFAPPARPTRSPAHTRPMTGVYAIGTPTTARRGVAGTGRPFFLKSVCLKIFLERGCPAGAGLQKLPAARTRRHCGGEILIVFKQQVHTSVRRHLSCNRPKRKDRAPSKGGKETRREGGQRRVGLVSMLSQGRPPGGRDPTRRQAPPLAPTCLALEHYGGGMEGMGAGGSVCAG